jgi:hypothetical protein
MAERKGFVIENMGTNSVHLVDCPDFLNPLATAIYVLYKRVS